MILTCPQCATRYRVDPETIRPEGRLVRCNRCGHSWTQTPPEEIPPEAAAETLPMPPATEPAVPPESAAPPEEPRPDLPPSLTADIERPLSTAGQRPVRARSARPRREPMPRFAIFLWTVLVVVVVGTVAAAALWQDAIVRTWPAAAPLYELAGLGADPPGTGLGLANVSWKAENRDGGRVLSVQGEVANLSDIVRDVPPIQGVLYDKENREVQRWTFAAPEARLLPGERIAFRSELKEPVPAASRLQIGFEAKKRF